MESEKEKLCEETVNKGKSSHSDICQWEKVLSERHVQAQENENRKSKISFARSINFTSVQFNAVQFR